MQSSPGPGPEKAEKHVGALKLGDDVLNTDLSRDVNGHRRLSTAMNPAADLGFGTASKLLTQSFNQMNKTTIGFVRKSESLRRPDLVSHNGMSKRRKRNYRGSVLNAISCEDRDQMLQSM